MNKTLGMASERLVMEGLSQFSDHGNYVVQTTPSEPDYWFGNQIIHSDPRVPATAALAQFADAFPTAKHIVISWDLPAVDRDQIDRAFLAAGCEWDVSDVLRLDRSIAKAPSPDGIVLRPLEDDADWTQAEALQLEIGEEEGRPAETYRGYIQRRNTNRRAQIARDMGQWFGAFDGDLLVAQMGMFHDDRVARYQSVETRASHRRCGICAALLRHSCLWALDRAPNVTPVIVAMADSDAGRLYRRMGFTHAETLIAMLKPGY